MLFFLSLSLPFPFPFPFSIPRIPNSTISLPFALLNQISDADALCSATRTAQESLAHGKRHLCLVTSHCVLSQSRLSLVSVSSVSQSPRFLRSARAGFRVAFCVVSPAAFHADGTRSSHLVASDHHIFVSLSFSDPE